MISLVSARTLVFTFLLILAPVLAHAAIGDSLTKLRSTYGSAKQVGNQMLFKHDGYSIAVTFDDSFSSILEIFVRDGSIPQKPDITQPDIDDILTTEGGGQTWHPVTAHSGQPTWLRADAKLIARFNPSEKILVIMINAH